MRIKHSATLAATAAFFFIHAPWLLHAQEIRRAIPVTPVPAPAIPFDFDKPTPTPTPAPTPRLSVPAPPQPEVPTPVAVSTPTPVPSATPPLITSQPPDKEQLEYANSFYAKKLYDLAAPEYEKYVSLYPHGVDLQTVYFRLAESYRANDST